MHSAAPILDRAVLGRLRALQTEEDPNLVAELVGDFLTKAPQRLERMRTQLAAGDARGLDFEVHGLVGSSGALGLMRLYGHAQALELLARGGTLEGAEALLTEVERAFEEARIALLAELDVTPSPSGRGAG
jgi:HPt (histidine-containing phosphotransfer) domain-containing protein